MAQLTSKGRCNSKNAYRSKVVAERARKRRNKSKYAYFARSYECNECGQWHLTTQVKEKENEDR